MIMTANVKGFIRGGKDFLTFDHCATRSDEIDDTSSAVTSETMERLVLGSLRFLNTFGEQRLRRRRLHGPLSHGGPMMTRIPRRLPFDEAPLLIHDVSILG